MDESLSAAQVELATTLEELGREEFCYLTTIGRVSGAPHKVEMWFAVEGPHVYLLAGGGEEADWVKNLRSQPAVALRIGTARFRAQARVVGDEAEEYRARRLLAAKYERWREGRLLSSWARIALPIAIDIMEREEQAGDT